MRNNKQIITLAIVGIGAYFLLDLYKKGKLPFFKKPILGNAPNKKVVEPSTIVLL
jgi:hypothetical protein